jgi:chromosome segregation ATPase
MLKKLEKQANQIRDQQMTIESLAVPEDQLAWKLAQANLTMNAITRVQISTEETLRVVTKDRDAKGRQVEMLQNRVGDLEAEAAQLKKEPAVLAEKVAALERRNLQEEAKALEKLEAKALTKGAAKAKAQRLENAKKRKPPSTGIAVALSVPSAPPPLAPEPPPEARASSVVAAEAAEASGPEASPEAARALADFKSAVPEP